MHVDEKNSAELALIEKQRCCTVRGAVCACRDECGCGCGDCGCRASAA